MDVDCINDIYDDLVKYMTQIRDSNDYHLVMFVITDIIKEGSEVIVFGESIHLLEKAFNVKVKDNKAFLQGVVSRKKQIIPNISNFI
jgi:manganese-dependent inorganic pyrophosphatase